MEDEQNRHSTGFQSPEGSRKIGRPCSTWNDNIRKDIENSGVTWEEALLLMTDRKELRSWIAQCARHGMD